MPETLDTTVEPELTLVALGWERSDPTRVLKTFPRNYYRFHFVTSGIGYYKTPAETVTLAENEGFVIFPGETPSYYPNDTKAWEYFWVAFSGSKAGELVAKAGLTRSSPAYRSTGGSDKMRQLLADICATSIMPLATDRLFPHYVVNFFDNIAPISSKRKKNSLYLEQCLSYIASNYNRPITIQDIANHANIDRTYLYKLFKKNLGTSPQTYLLNYRLDKACDLLQSTQDSITDIAYNSGFSDYSNFSRQFKAAKNFTPSAYRLANGQINTWDL